MIQIMLQNYFYDKERKVDDVSEQNFVQYYQMMWKFGVVKFCVGKSQ